MADAKDIQLQQDQLKQVEALLSSVEQRMQRLAILKKSIELQLIDPKDTLRFDYFLKQLASVDVSNIEALRGFISGANDKFDELIHNNKIFSKQSESSLKAGLMMDKAYGNVASKIDSANKSTQQLNSSLEETDDLIEKYVKGLEEGLDTFMDLDKIQAAFESGLENISKKQEKNIKNAFGLNKNYDQVSGNILDIGKKLENTGTVTSNMFQFDVGIIDEFGKKVDQTLSNIGGKTFTIDGEEISSEFRESLLRGITGTGDVLAKNMGDRIERAKQVIKKKSGETSEVIDAMIADLEAKSIDPDAKILSPEMEGKVSAAWDRIAKSGNTALMDMIINTSKSSLKLKQFNARLNESKDAIGAIEKIQKQFEGVGRAADSALDSLQFATRSLMPNWLYQTLDLDTAFQNISQNASAGLKQVATNIALGQSPMQAMAGFAGSFTSSLLKSVGVIGLITIGVSALWNMMTAAGESVKELSKEFGVSRNTAHGMYKDILNITAAVENTSIKQEDVLEVLKKHRDQYGLIMDLNNKANQESVKFAAELGKQYGVGAGEAYAFTQQLQQLGADKAASEEIAAVTAYASDLAGIPFNTITKDLAESSEFVAIQFAGYPLKAVEAATKLRAMGTSLKSVEKAMEKAFDTGNFLKGMTELNIMTRGVVDLSEMFRKSMAGDSVGAAKELTKQFDKMVASGQMNQFTMRQFAQVTGQSADELLRGNKIRKMDAELGKDNVELLTKYVGKLNEADVADAKSAMKAAKKLSAAEKLDTIWASIKDTLTEALMPALEGISDLIVAIAPALKIIGLLFKGIGIVIKGIAAPIALVVDLVSGIGDIIKGDMPQFERIKSLFGEWDGILGGIANIVAIIIGAFAGMKMLGAISKLTGGFSGMWETLKGMGTSIKGLGPALQNAFSGLKGEGSVLGKIKDSFKNMFSGADDGKSFFEKVKGGVKGLFGKTTDATTPAAPGEKKSLLSKGMDTVKGFLGMGGEETGDPLQAPADALSEAANELKAAADALSNSGSSMLDSLDRGKKGRSGGRRGGRGGRGGRAAGRGRTQGSAKPRTSTPKVKTPANQISPKTSTTPKVKAPDIKTPASSTGSKVGGMFDKMKTGGKNLLSKGKDMIKPGNIMKGLKSFNPAGLLTAAAGMGVDYLGSKYEEDAMKTGDQGAMNKSRALKAGGKALEYGGIGATIGSIIPGIGTAVGGAVGGVIGGAVGIWENYFSEDAKKQDEQLKQIREGNKIANGLNALTESEIQQLKDAGYSDDVIKKLSEGNVSLEGAIKEQFSEFNLNEDQLKKLADPKTTGKERDIIMQTAAGIPAPELAVGTNLVKSDGMAMLHQGEAVVPADVVEGGFNMSGGSVPIPLPVKVVNGGGIPEPESGRESLIQKFVERLSGKREEPELKVLQKTTIQPEVKPDIAMPVKQQAAPVNNEMTDVGEIATRSTTYTPQPGSPPPMSSGGGASQDALLKQLMSIMQDVANRPVQVQIGGVELKSLNNKMKVFNNKA